MHRCAKQIQAAAQQGNLMSSAFKNIPIKNHGWLGTFFLSNSWHRTGHGESSKHISLFAFSEKEKHFHCEFSWTSMTDTQQPAQGQSRKNTNTPVQYNVSFRRHTLFVCACLVFCVPACLQPVLLQGRTSTHALSWQRGPQAEWGEHTSCSTLRPQPIIHIRLISFSAVFAFIN